MKVFCMFHFLCHSLRYTCIWSKIIGLVLNKFHEVLLIFISSLFVKHKKQFLPKARENSLNKFHKELHLYAGKKNSSNLLFSFQKKKKFQFNLVNWYKKYYSCKVFFLFWWHLLIKKKICLERLNCVNNHSIYWAYFLLIRTSLSSFSSASSSLW